MNPKNPSPLQWQFDEDEDANLLLGEELFGGLGLLESLSQSRDQSVHKSTEDGVELAKFDEPESDLLITNNVQNLNVNASTFTPSKLSISSELDPEFSPNYFNGGGYHYSDQNLDVYGQQQVLPEIDIQEYTNNLRRLGKEFIKYGTAYLKERNNQKPFYVEYIREQLAERVQNNTLGFTIYSIDLLVEGLIKLMQIDGRLLYDTSYRAKYDVFWLNKSELTNVHGHQQFQQFKQHDQQQLQQQQQHILLGIPQSITSNGPYFSPNQISPQDAYLNTKINKASFHGLSPQQQQQIQQQQHLLQPFKPQSGADGVRPPVPPGPPPLSVHNGGAASQGQFPPNRVQLPVQKIGEMKSTLLQERYDSVVKEIAEDIIVNAVKRLQRHNNLKPFRVNEIKNSLKHRETLLKHWLTAAEASVIAIMKTDVRLVYEAAYRPPNDTQSLEVFWLSGAIQPVLSAPGDDSPLSPPGLAAPPGLSSSTTSSVNNSVANSVTNSVASSPDIAASPPVAISRPNTSVPKLKMALAKSPPPLIPHLSALERINKLPAAGVGGISPRDGIASPRDAVSVNSPRDGAGTVRQITSTTQSSNRANQAASVRTTSPLPGGNQQSVQTIVVKAVSNTGNKSGGLNKGGTSTTGGMTIIRETSPPGGATTSTVVTTVPQVVSTENVINSIHDTSSITAYLAVIAKMAKMFGQKAISHLEGNHNKNPYLVANIRIAIAKSDFEASIAYKIPDQEEFLLDVIDTLREDDRLLYASKNSENLLEGFWLNKSQ